MKEWYLANPELAMTLYVVGYFIAMVIITIWTSNRTPFGLDLFHCFMIGVLSISSWIGVIIFIGLLITSLILSIPIKIIVWIDDYVYWKFR